MKVYNSSLVRNISKGFVWQGIGIIATLISLPLSIGFLGKYNYGLWITLYGVILWMSGFDLGVGNGLRNQLAVSFAIGNKEKSSLLVTNGFIAFSSLAGILIILGLFVNFILYKGYCFRFDYYENLYILVNILLFYFGFEFIFKMTGIIYTSDQRASIVPLITGINNLLVLLSVYFLTKMSIPDNNRLMIYGIFVGLIPVISNGTLTLIGFSTRYRYLIPKFKNYQYYYIGSILRTGIKFFGIQVSMIFLMQMSNILITTWSNAEYVTMINIADKYFGIISIIGTIILFPFWSAFTAANERNEHSWIKKTIVKLEYIFVGLTLLGILLLLIFPFIVKHWFKNTIEVPVAFTVIILLKNLFIILNSIYSYYLNAIGKVKIQLVMYILFAVINFPISFLLYQLLGPLGIILFMPMAMLIMALVQKQYILKILKVKLIA